MRLPHFLRTLFGRRRAEAELKAELQFHLEQEAAAHERAGLSPAEARLAAQRDFGGVAQVEEQCREAWGTRFLDTLRQDLAYGRRGLGRNPGYSLIIVLTLALGIGANTAIFSLVHGVLLRDLPYAEPSRLVALQQNVTRGANPNLGFSATDLADYRARLRAFEGLVEYHAMWFILLGREEPERVQTAVVSHDFFRLLGVPPMLGRDFRPEEDEPGAPAVLILGHDYWQRSFGGDPGVVGRVFEMNNRPHTVVGVMPPLPAYPGNDMVFMPTAACPTRAGETARTQRDFRMIGDVIGRVKPGVPLAQAEADLRRVAAELCGELPQDYRAEDGYTATLRPLAEAFTGGARTPLLVLLATSGFVLLIACANVANLTLARLVRRERELAVRATLGAGRRRIFRQLLTENLLLALTGGAAGIALAAAGLDALTHYTARYLPRSEEIALNAPVLGFALLLSVLTGLAFGSRPALPSAERLMEALKDGARGSGAGGNRLRALLVVSQVAVSVPLLVGAGLAARSVLNLQRTGTGLETERALGATVNLNWSRYGTAEARREFWLRAVEQARAVPGVIAAGVTANEPLNGLANFRNPFVVEGRPRQEGAAGPAAAVTVVDEDYFTVVGQPLLRGRSFHATDTAEAPGVLVVNQSLARRHWPEEDAVGRRVSFDRGRTWLTVVGVVADARQQIDREAEDEAYVPLRRSGPLAATLMVRTAGDPASFGAPLREALRRVDPLQPVTRIQTLAQVRANALVPSRLLASLLGLFALLALVITAAGIGGVLAFTVSQRTQEIGIRVALGASRGDVLWMVLREGLALVGTGLVLGLGASLALVHLMGSLLYGVPATDPATFLLVCGALLLVAALACALPARRATGISPMIALRAS